MFTNTRLVNIARTLFNTALVLALGTVLLFEFTHGLSVFTSEGERRLSVQQNPLALPKVDLIDSDKNNFRITDYQNKIVLIDFIFTHCNSICSMLTQHFKTLSGALQDSGLQAKVVLLTVSFDPQRDSPAVLKRYSQAVGADSGAWRFATVANKNQLQALLDTFGIIVIPAPHGQFEHNSAIHLINEDHKLAKIYDTQAIDKIIADLKNTYGNA